MRILITGRENTGKTTAALGSKKFKVKGLNPKETLFLTASGKELPIRFAKTYKQIAFSAIPPEHVAKASPIIKNFIVIDPVSMANLDDLSTYVKRACTFGIKNEDGDTYKCKNVIIDDLQNFINDNYFLSKEKDNFKAIRESGTKTLSLIALTKRISVEQAQKSADLDRTDFFIFMHVMPKNIEEKLSKKNPMEFKVVGSLIKGKYPLKGEFDNIFYAENFKFKVAPAPGLEYLRAEEGFLDEEVEINADLGIVKDFIDAMYK